jgi:CRP-like cAMP-binding protein
VYEIKYSLDDEARFNDIEDTIRTNIWYEAKRAGIQIPFPQRVLHITRNNATASRESTELRSLCRKLDLLAPLSEAQLETLLENARLLQFGRGETIIHQGNEGCSMFFVLRGELEIIVIRDGVETRIATLKAAEAFGEMCLLTGEARTATVRALSDSIVWEIRRSQIQPILKENPQLADRMSEMLAQRKVATESILSTQAPQQSTQEKAREYERGFLAKMRSLFEI